MSENEGKPYKGLKHKKIFVLIVLSLLFSLIFILYKFTAEWQGLPSENKPYYLEVQKYRFILDAEREKKRLKDLGFPSFYIPTNEPKTGKWLVVGIGPEKEIDKIKNLQEKASTQGITSVVKNYIEEKDNLITDRTEIKEILKEMHNWYKKIERKEQIVLSGILSVIPHIPEFSIDRVIYINHEANPPKILEKVYKISYPEEIMPFKDRFIESAYFFYIDRLKKESVEVYGATLKEEIKNDWAIQYKSKLGQVSCNKKESKKESVYYLCAISQYVFVIIGNNDNTLTKFIRSIGAGMKSDPYAYNLFLSSFPIGVDSKLQVFVIDYIDQSYVISKNYAKWAEMMLGYWTSLAFFVSPEGNFHVELFDLEHRDYAASVYKIFSDEKYSLRGSIIYEFMKAMKVYSVPVNVRDKQGWYIDLASWGRGKEVSFTCDEYIVAVGTDSSLGKFLMRKELLNVASNLNIFEKK